MRFRSPIVFIARAAERHAKALWSDRASSMKPRLVAEGMMSVYERLERPLIRVLSDMEQRGISIDRQILSRLSGELAQRAAAIVKATTFHDDPDVVAKVSRGLGEAMVGINVEELPQPHRLAERGW